LDLLSLEIVQALVTFNEMETSEDENIRKEQLRYLIINYGEYLTGNSHIKYDDALEVLRDVAIDGLYEYLDEQIDTRNVLYAVLLKYKQRSEWFRRARLRAIAENGLEGKNGERALAADVQEYVLDQGVEFIVEPTSASGEADLILRDSEGRYIIIDAKYIPPDATRSRILETIASGFNQVSRYCNDYNEPEGFLATFVCTSTKIRLELEETDGFRFLSIGGKTIYYLPINIADLPSASVEGKATEMVFPATELIESVPSPT